jgi:ATP/maltotriose-dependent transcriptional regulator MalT
MTNRRLEDRDFNLSVSSRNSEEKNLDELQ